MMPCCLARGYQHFTETLSPPSLDKREAFNHLKTTGHHKSDHNALLTHVKTTRMHAHAHAHTLSFTVTQNSVYHAIKNYALVCQNMDNVETNKVTNR